MSSLQGTSLGVLLNHFRLLKPELIWLRVFQNEPFKKWILDLIRQDQLYKKGIDEDGDIIGVYSEWTEMMNPQKVAGTPYTLHDTGQFYNSFIIFVGNQMIEIDADTIKMENNNWWNQNGITKNAILGLTDENKTKLALEVKDRYIKETRLLLGIR